MAVVEDHVGATGPTSVAEPHGTAVAGIIASIAGNGVGIVGIAPGVEVLALRACWRDGAEDAAARCSSFTLARAISAAIKLRAQVLNLSLTGPPDPLVSRLLVEAQDRGLVVVAAADRRARPSTGFPASLPGVISVAVQSPTADDAFHRTPALVGAPGVDVLTTVPHGRFDFISGSSMAAAHVSGVAALLLERDRTLTSERILELLQGAPAPGESRRTVGGKSRPTVGPVPLNACAALVELVPGADCPSGARTSS